MAIISLLLLSPVFIYPILVLQPLIRLAKQNKRQESLKRFSIVDLVSLVFLIQLAFIIPSITQADMSELPFWVIGLLILVAVIIWFVGLRALNQIGVGDWRKRLVCVALTLPLSILGGFILVLILSMIMNDLIVAGDRDFTFNIIFLAISGFALMMFATFKSAQWIATNSFTNPCKLTMVDANDNE